MIKTFKRFGNYFIFLLWGVIFTASLFFPASPFFMLVGFLFLLFLPGFSLARLFKITTAGDKYDQWMIYLATGVSLNFLLCFLAIFIKINIFIFVPAYLIILLSLFVLAFILDLKRKTEIATNITLKQIFSVENLIYLIPISLLGLVILFLDLIGADFAGDPSYHISIIRKVVDGGQFGVAELSFLKNVPQVQYAYPIWLTFLGLLSKIFSVSIFTIWDEITVGLTVVSALTWGWVFKKIFNLRLVAILGVIVLLVVSMANNGWLFMRFPVPDNVCKLFLLPLIIALSFEYLFAKARDRKILWLTTLILFWTAFIHSTQYVYYFFMIGAFGAFYALLFWKNVGYKEFLKRIGLLIVVPIAFFFPFLVYLEAVYNVVGDSLAWFATSKLILIYGQFKDYEPFVQVAFILLPFTAIFFRKNPKILFLAVIMLIAPTIYYFEPLREFISLKLSFVLVRRMFTNTTWYFAILALFGGFLIIIINRALEKLKERPRIIANYVLLVLTLLLIGLEGKLHWLSLSYRALFGTSFSRFLEHNYIWLIVISIIIALLVVIWQKFSPKADTFFELKEPKNIIPVLLLTFLFTFWFTSEVRPIIQNKIQPNLGQFFLPAPDAMPKAAQTEDIGGDDVLEFIKTQLPKRPIFETSSGFRDLSQLADVYMSAWPGVYAPDKELSNMYRTNTPMNEKFACLSYWEVEYLLLAVDASRIELLGFGTAPDYLELVFTKTHALKDGSLETIQIYKIDRTKIESDFPFKKGDQPPVCRAPKYRE